MIMEDILYPERNESGAYKPPNATAKLFTTKLITAELLTAGLSTAKLSTAETFYRHTFYVQGIKSRRGSGDGPPGARLRIAGPGIAGGPAAGGAAAAPTARRRKDGAAGCPA